MCKCKLYVSLIELYHQALASVTTHCLMVTLLQANRIYNIYIYMTCTCVTDVCKCKLCVLLNISRICDKALLNGDISGGKLYIHVHDLYMCACALEWYVAVEWCIAEEQHMNNMSCLGSSVVEALCLECRVLWVQIPPEAAHFPHLEK